MGKPRDRISYMKLVEGEVEDFERDGRWVNLLETVEGGAILDISAEDLKCIEKLKERLTQGDRMIEIKMGNNGTDLILVDETGTQIPFIEVSKILFG
jgi:hypothetical protein